ncbi:MAG: RNA 2',3'-cyclic phosphodiesterase [Candidatus Eisenbacteria bacterium]|nr:RNA 2',3'-cyclic phosphodiesterase [Candidatus Eisenbacteria bacterium]
MNGARGEERIRAFLALPLSEEQRAELDRKVAPLRVLGEPVRWVPAENLHVTLRFFGDIGNEGRARIEKRVRQAASGTAPFLFRLGAAGAFPNLRGARVLWVGVSEGEEALVSLAARVEDSIEGLGFPREKRFHAHITVGRTKGALSPRFRDRFAALPIEPIEARAGSFLLMKSTLDPRGARYEVLHTFEF